jgi:DNA (cytosine-5)-methyltransferase 1
MDSLSTNILPGEEYTTPRKKISRPMLVADLFAGAGGTDRGAKMALERLGYRMELVAVNHDEMAIASNKVNFPDARHHIADVNAAQPWLLVPEGRLDLLMASPSCTHHSRARGGKPTSDQQRMDPWAIITWISQLRVKRLLIENVPEYAQWGPVDTRTGKPIKSRRGEYFRAWLAALAAHGMVYDYRILNCADYGDATTRQRFFLLGRSDGKPIRWPEATHAQASKAHMLGLKPWRPAREIIDWTVPGRSIFNRKKPLAAATLARIEAGARKFRWPEPFLVILRRHMAGQSVDGPLPTIAAGGQHIGLAQPFLLNRHGENGGIHRAHDLGEPVPTADCRGAGYLVEPFLATVAHGDSAREADPSTRRARSLDDPLQTIHAGGGKFALVEPFILSQASEGSPRSVGEPIPAIPCDGAHALIAPYYGEGSGQTCKPVDQPLDTVTAKARFGLVVPVTNSNGGPNPRSMDEPLPTLTTAKGGEFAMVMPVTHGSDRSDRARDVEEPLPTVTAAHRGELAFIAAAFGEREGQAPRVHSIEEPTPTVCATGHVNLVEALGYDILFRMLEPHELAGAMSLADHTFLGTKEQKTRQIGNAVPAETAAALVGAVMAT